jgi:hypothetical protein
VRLAFGLLVLLLAVLLAVLVDYANVVPAPPFFWGLLGDFPNVSRDKDVRSRGQRDAHRSVI